METHGNRQGSGLVSMPFQRVSMGCRVCSHGKLPRVASGSHGNPWQLPWAGVVIAQIRVQCFGTVSCLMHVSDGFPWQPTGKEPTGIPMGTRGNPCHLSWETMDNRGNRHGNPLQSSRGPLGNILARQSQKESWVSVVIAMCSRGFPWEAMGVPWHPREVPWEPAETQ